MARRGYEASSLHAVSERPTVFTIGHGPCSFAEIERLLAAHSCQTIVDVRSQPYSRHAPEFNKRPLADLAATAGLGYRWMGDRLGGRPDDPGMRDAGGAPHWDRIAASPGFAAGMAELSELARGGRVAVLCAEREPDHCHRTGLIAPHLEAGGFAVLHILADGSARPHQPPLFR